MSHSGKVQREAFVSKWLVLSLVVVAAVAGTAAYMAAQWQLAAERESASRTMGNLFSNMLPVAQLDELYQDHNGDMVADPPENPALRVKPTTLVFSFIASEDSTNEPEMWQELMDAVAEKTGIEVSYLRVTTPREQTEALRNGRLHITAMGSGEVPAAVNTAGFVPFCTLGRDDGSYGYQMNFIVKADSNIEKLADLRDRQIAFTRPRSNSGCKAPLVLLMEEARLQPEIDYQWRYTYGHTGSVEAVIRGDVDAAPVASDVMERMIAKGEIAEDDFRVIYQSERFPPAAFGYAYNLEPEISEAIGETLVEFDWEGTRLEEEFAVGGVTQFVPVNYKDDWANIRRVDKAANAARVALVSNQAF